MHRGKTLLKRAFTPITIMLIPHSSVKSMRIKIPTVGILVSVVMWMIGMVYVFSVAVSALEYQKMKKSMEYYSGQFLEMRSTIISLKNAESEFRRIFSFKTKEKVLDHIDTSDNGSLDIENLKKQIQTTMETVGEIKDYLSQQKDLYVATPRGYPVDGNITSAFGLRQHPRTGENDYHSGIDIATDPGTPVRATADGVVSFADWNGANGNLAAIEHGFGFSTFYAHNKMLAVKVGQRVKRGDVIGYIGSTGNSTGPHVHYEIWKNGRPLNPSAYLERRS